MRTRWPLAVCGVTPATRASSEDVNARPSINACSIPARAGSPARAAISAKAALLAMSDLLDREVPVIKRSRTRCFGPHRNISTACAQPRPMHSFYGWRVVGAAFVLAVFGWGIGFYGPPVFLRVICETRGWPLAMVLTAVTVHFLVGAVVGANLPVLHRRLGVATATKAGALCLAIGVFGWAAAVAPWQLFLATLLSGAGWSAMSAAAVNAIVSPWFVRRRPAALAMAYNGGSIGGVIFAPP